jgi:hypothetical protein
METCEVDVISISELLEAVCGKIEDLAVIKAKLKEEESLSDRGWKAFHIANKDSYRPSDSPFEEDTAFAGLTTIFE